jgi:pimeloyl-ACP methyl ester carboxylesterase
MRFVLESGRRVAVHLTSTRALNRATAEDGRDERLVVFCHGAPGAGSFDPEPTATRASRVTLLGVDRPGYGRSDPVSRGEWATVRSAADDIAGVLDMLPVNRVGVVGWSAGGRVALALAAARPDLVDGVVVVSTPAPDDEVAWIRPEHRALLDGLRTLGPREAHAELERRLAPLVPSDAAPGDALWLLATDPPEEPVLADRDVRMRVGEMLRAAFAQGAVGLAADIAGSWLQPWGFEPEQVQAKTLLLYGSRDPVAGPPHGRWWQERLPDARLEVTDGAGHLLLIPTWPRALAHVAPNRPRLRVVPGIQGRAAEPDFEGSSAA